MPALFLLLASGRVERVACPTDAPLFLDARGAVVTAGWQVAIVGFASGERAPHRHALVAAPGAEVLVGGRPLPAGTTELRDRERFLVGNLEAIFSTDAVPAPVDGTDGPCPVCCEPLAPERRLLRCPACGLHACARCWSLAPRRACLSPGCGQSADLDRPLWAAAASDFVSAEVVP